MKKILLICLTLLVAMTLTAGPAGLVIKGVTRGWDELAEMCLKVSGRSTSKASVEAASKTLAETAAKYGDDVARAATKGGIEVAEQALRHGDDFVNVLRRASSPAAIRLAATHTDDVLRFVPRYGDDVLRVGAKAQGQIGPLVRTLEAKKLPVKDSLKMLDALNAEELPRVVGALERANSPRTAQLFLDTAKAGGSKFLDKLFGAGGGTVIMTTGLSVAAITAAVRLTGENKELIESQTKWAQSVLADPNATQEEKEVAQEVLLQTGATSESIVVKTMKAPLLIIASAVGLLIILWGMFRFLPRKRKDAPQATIDGVPPDKMPQQASPMQTLQEPLVQTSASKNQSEHNA